MAFRKPRIALRALTTIVMVFSILFAFLLQRSIMSLSQRLIRIRSLQPCTMTREVNTIHGAGESLKNGDQKQDGDDKRRAPVSGEQTAIHDANLRRKEAPQENHVIIDGNSEEHAVEDGPTEVRAGAKHNLNVTDEKPFPETKEEESSSDASDQEHSDGHEHVHKGETKVQEMNDAAVKLPPGLAPTLSHLKRSSTNPLTAPIEWKRPMMLSVLGIPREKKLLLTMFTTGVHLIGFKRSFNFVGCLVGNKTYPKFQDKGRSPYCCLIDSDIPQGATITMLITRNEVLEEAMAKPYVVKEFVFEVKEEDLLQLDGNVKISKEVQELSDGYEPVGIKSDIKWHEGLREPEYAPKAKRYELCLMTAMRQYPFLMQQWFDYYRQMGVDQIYVYDNVSLEDLSQFDSEFVQTGFWPYGRSQYQSFNHFLHLGRNRCKYVGFLDADEYIFVGDSDPGALKRYIKKRMSQGYDQIIFPFIVMAGGGRIERPEGFLPNLYMRRDLRQEKFHVGKSIISTDIDYDRHMVHYAQGGKSHVNSTFELNPTSLDHNAMLVHYTRRSWEEYIMKTNAGGASVVTNARAPRHLTMESVPRYYRSNDSTVEYLTFRDQWRTIMAREQPTDISLVWKWYGKECKQRYCIACTEKKLVGKPDCSFL